MQIARKKEEPSVKVIFPKSAMPVNKKVAGIPVGQIVNDLVIKANPRQSLYKKLANCSVMDKKKGTIVETFLWMFANHILIAQQIALRVSDVIYPDEEILSIYDLKTGKGVNVVIAYRFDKSGRKMRGKFVVSELKASESVKMYMPTTGECEKIFNKFVPTIRLRRIKNVAIKGI